MGAGGRAFESPRPDQLKTSALFAMTGSGSPRLLRNSSCRFHGNEFKTERFGFFAEVGFLAFLVAQLIGGELAIRSCCGGATARPS